MEMFRDGFDGCGDCGLGEMFTESFDGAPSEIKMLKPPKGFVATGEGHLREPRLNTYDWILINTSAGKDSQVMMEEVVAQAKSAGVKDRIIAVHCDLGEAEWEGCRELAEEQSAHYGLTAKNGQFEVVHKHPKGSDRHISFLQRARTGFENQQEKGKKLHAPWPGQTTRWCTSELKTAPVSELMTRLIRPRNGKGTRFLNCLGIRGQESGLRAACQFCKGIERPEELKSKQAQQKLREKWEVGTGTWRPRSQCWVCGGSGERAHMHPDPDSYGNDRWGHPRQEDRWYPIHAMSKDTVWRRIAAAPVVPHHPAYDIGFPRLSCVFCIYGSKEILTLAGHYNRALLERYAAFEEECGFTFTQSTSLAEVLKRVKSTTIEQAREEMLAAVKSGKQCGPGD